MLTKNQQLWVDALRSGKYQQGTGALQCGESYCCLGVACIVAEEHEVEVDYFEDGRVVGVDLLSQRRVMSWLSLRTHLGDIGGAHLAELNDKGMTFLGIANVIERNAATLFKQGTPV